jgi:hypothetical protein
VVFYLQFPLQHSRGADDAAVSLVVGCSDADSGANAPQHRTLVLNILDKASIEVLYSGTPRHAAVYTSCGY